ncbi:hypothetical protein M3Y97_00941700 [Aphelenchoides bicaudatus]|nr:hypothetical protein M3Y97_00941700 [Aphelenchoides bicaudatus]
MQKCHFLLSLFLLFWLGPKWRTRVVRADNDLTSILRRNVYYNRDEVPTYKQGSPTNVVIQMYIEGMSSFRAQSMDFHLDCYLYLRWVDERLAHNGTNRILVKDLNLFNLIWHPDLYFANARTADFHHVTAPNFSVWIYGNGTVFYDTRISLTVICMLNLARYPLDSQLCSLRILSYAYDVEQLVIEWSPQAVMSNKEIRMPDMKLREIRPGLRNDSYATGTWACATADFIVDRLLVHHIIQSYVPQCLIVVISWISFWLDVEAVPGRVSLSITTLLTLATQSSAERMTLPQASYVKASDVFGGACMTFVFAALIEFTIVNYCTRRKVHESSKNRYSLASQARKMAEKQMDLNRYKSEMQFNLIGSEDFCDRNGDNEKSGLFKRQNSTAPSFPLPMPTTMVRQHATRKLKMEQRLQRIEENRKIAQAIDMHCRAWFPLAFILFNTIYWVYYLYVSFLTDIIDLETFTFQINPNDV